MLGSLLSTFGFRRPPSSEATQIDQEEEIPRYPPFAKGLPVAPIDKVLGTQSELVERIRNALGFTKEQHTRLILPVISRYAEFVHLLPASEAHHHRGAGGLFRHGLEVAFWAAQASEAIIFSMEGSPRERRGNEPRWRLASCFAGLLHDVGKPISDVSVTNHDGTVVWNPYASTLYEWARRHNVERYFLRWRHNRHKRHEQFSLLTIERIIPPDVLGFLSEAGPEVLESMLEAIAGTSSNQPVTKLMLKADQESVSRDLKQSRLNVDEFSYGVPVERYVFDAIRRLVKTGKWKVNEAGARVWNIHQGVFITWRQIGDLYEMISKDNIPGIPRDPDTLADILIERGFAIPNKVVTESGDSAQYRYWEICPDFLTEGVEAGSVKLLALRLESHELVFTTEPPVPVKAIVIGEKSEPVIEFEDIDEQDQILSPAEPPTAEAVDPQPDQEETAETVTAYPPPDTGGVSSLGSPLEGILDGTGEMGIPFEFFGMEEPSPATLPEEPIEKTPEPTNASPADIGLPGMPGTLDVVPEQARSEEAGAEAPLDLSHLFLNKKGSTRQKPKELSGAADDDLVNTTHKPVPISLGTETVSVDSSKKEKTPSVDTAENAEAAVKIKSSRTKKVNSPQISKQSPMDPGHGCRDVLEASEIELTAKQKLNEFFEGLGDEVRTILESAINPVLAGEQMLGEIVLLFDRKPGILYPEGASLLGEPSHVLAVLWGAGMIEEDPLIPSRKVRDIKGTKGIIFAPKLAALVVDALSEEDNTRESVNEAVLRPLPAEASAAPNMKPTRKRPSRPGKSDIRAGKTDSPFGTEDKPSNTLAPESDSRDQPADSFLKGILGRSGKNPHADPTKIAVQPKQNRMPVMTSSKPINRPKKLPDIVSIPVNPSEIVIPEIGENTLKMKGQAELTADFDDIRPSTITDEEAITQLKEMILKREGRWIVGGVIKKEGVLYTSAKALDAITGEFPDISKTGLRAALLRRQDAPELIFKEGQLMLPL